MERLKVSHTIIPFSYDLNGTRDKHSKSFTRGFNRWSVYIRSSVDPTGDRLLKEAKQLISERA